MLTKSFPALRNSNKDAYDSSNASFIYDSNPKEAVFIASQSPMPSTITQFWRMIWENKVSTIVMLAVIKDKGDVKGCRSVNSSSDVFRAW